MNKWELLEIERDKGTEKLLNGSEKELTKLANQAYKGILNELGAYEVENQNAYIDQDQLEYIKNDIAAYKKQLEAAGELDKEQEKELNRLEALKRISLAAFGCYFLGKHLDKLFNGSNGVINGGLTNIGKETNDFTTGSLNDHTGNLKDPVNITPEKWKELLGGKLSGKNWADRLNANREFFKKKMLNIMKVYKDPAIIAKRFKKLFNTIKYSLKRLIRTEAAFLIERVKLQVFKAFKVLKCQFTAVLDGRTSQICLANDGNILDVKDVKPGHNAPPLHPNCRSTLIPIID